MEAELQLIKRNVAIILRQFDYQRKDLEPKALRSLKSIIRDLEQLIPAFVDLLFQHLRSEDSDLRLGILLITNYFFQRSHKFRLELINSLQDFLVYTLETDPLHYPLPKPPEAAKLLKKETLTTVRLWVEKFGAGYQKLANLKQFLNSSKNFDFERSNAELLVERNSAEQERFNRELKQRKVVEKVGQLHEEHRLDIQKCLTEARTVIELIFPKFCPIDESNKTQQNGSASNQLHGFMRPDTVITVNIRPEDLRIEQTNDNADLLNALNDSRAMLTMYLGKVNKWLKKLAEVGDSSAITRRLIDNKRDLCEELSRCKELKVAAPGTRTSNDLSGQDSSDDDEFVDVEEKEGFEEEFFAPEEDSLPSSVLRRIEQMEDDADKPGPSGLQKSIQSQRPTRNSGNSLDGNGAKAPPKLDFGLDLKYWGQEVEPAELVRNDADSHRFWRTPDEDQGPVTEAAEAYKARLITFVGEMPAIERHCHTRMPSGRLCPRMDRERCPIHGPIIDRDEEGFPLKELPEASSTLSAVSERLRKQKELEEREYLRDVEAVTGVNLVATEKRRNVGDGQAKKRTARLREKSEGTKSRERLETKLLDKRTLNRVSQTLSQIQKAKAERRFAHQFNYALSNKR